MVYATGTDLDLATEVVFCISDGSATRRTVAATHYATYAEASFSGLAPATTYTLWAEAATAEGGTVKSAETRFTTLAPTTSHWGWMELPAKGALSTAKEYSYTSGTRNYTAYYDTATYSSLWVAYPLAAGHTGSLERPANWSAAPDIAEVDQINVWKGSYGVDVGSTIYARGHQIPNADRNGVEWMQNQTFYAINSTPQIQNGFNGGIWSALESAVRAEISSRDTIFVVTGPVYRTKGGSETVKTIQPQHDSKKCQVPNYYFKAVLKVKRDNDTGKVTNASAVGFWFEHKVYSDSKYENCAVSVDYIEQMTGFDLFANLPAAVESAAEQNTSWTTFSGF